MSDSFVDKYARRDGQQGGGDGGEPVDGLGCFGILRGIRDRAPAIELRRKTGAVLVVSYSYIEKMEFDPTNGVTLRSGGQSIRLKGRNLAADIRPNIRLITALASQRLAWVQEVGKPDLVMAAASQIPVVEAIEW